EAVAKAGGVRGAGVLRQGAGRAALRGEGDLPGRPGELPVRLPRGDGGPLRAGAGEADELPGGRGDGSGGEVVERARRLRRSAAGGAAAAGRRVPPAPAAAAPVSVPVPAAGAGAEPGRR